MEKQFENIYMKRFFYFNIYIIKGIDGDILIDTGFIFMKKRLKKWLDNFNIKLIILTHIHPDHTWNVAYLKDLYNCEVAIGKKEFNNTNTTNSKASNPLFIIWSMMMKLGLKLFKPQKFSIDYKLNDNEIINKFGLELKIHYLPGHTNGSIGILHKEFLFVGDALVNRGKITIAYQNQNNNMSKKSFNKIFQINPKIIFLGHDKEYLNKKNYKIS